MYKINFKISAREDLKNIKDYIFKVSFSIEISNKIYNEIMAHILNLKIMPKMYPVFKEDLRVMTVRKKYRVFYKIFEEKREVIIYYIFGVEEDYESLIY